MRPRDELAGKALAGLALAAALFFAAGAGPDVSLEEARRIPVQHAGRVKPFEAFARATLRLVAGRETWGGKPATAALFEALADPAGIAAYPWIRVDGAALKRTLGLDASRTGFSLEELRGAAAKVHELALAAEAGRARGERPSRAEEEAERLARRMSAVEALVDGSALKVAPSASGAWTPPSNGPDGAEFRNMVRLFASGDRAGFRHAAERWNARVDEAGRVERWKIEAETRYLDLKPFESAAACYFFGAALLATPLSEIFVPGAGPLAIALGFLLHAAGLGVRVAVLGRPPVSNTYESMVYMAWALMLFASAFYASRRQTAVLTSGAVLSGLVIVYTALLPLDPSLDVVMPVLRSNYWLSIHVLTIVSSYGAFGLAAALGHRHLFLKAARKLAPRQAVKSAELTYGAIQLGVLLIGVGTFLGGIWANESWGRFWGWDTKETWALITFLGYLAAVHLRHEKRLSDDGIAFCAVTGFLSVLMTWYGVDFVPGSGLHGYGAGSGGTRWIACYLGFEAAFVVFVAVRRAVRR